MRQIVLLRTHGSLTAPLVNATRAAFAKEKGVPDAF